jgi:MerR family transcriptional regulator, light-induced transcriptional regulator
MTPETSLERSRQQTRFLHPASLALMYATWHRAGMEARVNDRFNENLAAMQRNAKRVAGPSSIDLPRPTGTASAGLLRHSLMQAIKGNILPVCKETLYEGRNGINDNAEPIRLPANRIASMAVAGAHVAEIHAYLRAQPLSVSRRLSLLEIAAQRIGENWVCDNLNFVDVTTAVGRLQSVFRRQVQEHPAILHRRGGGQALIMPAPGEEHVFGCLFVENLFRAAGWATSLSLQTDPAGWVELAGARRPDVICISWSSERWTETLAGCLGRLRRNFAGQIIIGGTAAVENAAPLVRMGADFVTGSPQSALDYAKRNLLKQHRREASDSENRSG